MHINIKKIAIFLFLFTLYLPHSVYAKAGGGKVHSSIYGIPTEKYTVKSIEYKIPSGIPLKDIRNFLFIKKGMKFSMYDLEKTVKILYASDYFSNISVFSRINKKQKFIYLKFIFFPKIYIKSVNIHGLKGTGISVKKILNSIPLKKKGRLLKYYKTLSENKIKEIMLKGGYPDTKVNISHYVLRNSKKYAVNIDIAHNKPILISKIFVGLKLYYPKNKVETLIKKLAYKPLNLYKIQKLRKKIWELYKNQGYLNAIIGKPKINYASKYNATVTLNVHPGYKIGFHFKGAKPLKQNFIENSVLGIKNVLIFDRGTFKSFQRVIRDFFKKEGYFFARVSFEEKKNETAKTIDVYYEIKRGYRVEIKAVTINGNKPVRKKTIIFLMKTRETSFFDREYFLENRLKGDITNIENYYNNEGYLSALISYNLKFNADKKSVAVTVNIKKGTRTIIKRVYISGLPDVLKADKKLNGYFSKMQTLPFYIIKAENGKNMLSTKLSDSGFVFSKVRLDIKYSKDKKYASLYYYIASGPRVRIKNVLIIGNTITKTYYIKSLLLFKKGQFYDQKKIIDTQNRLYRAGIFNSVSIKVENPKNKKPDKSIIVKVKDAKPLDFSFGAGYGTYARYRGFVQIENNNLFGTGKSLSARFSKSAIYTNLLLNYYDPAIYNYKGLAFNAQGLDTDIITLNYTMHKEGAAFSLIRRFNKSLKGLLSYGMFYDYISGLNPGVQITPRDTGFTRISSASSSIIYNSKNNVFNPTSGNLTTLRLAYSTFLVDSQINFFKIFFHTEEYIPFIYNTVFLFSLRFGYIKPLPPTIQVPINERFFLGGRTTVRGFPQDSIGLVNLNPYGYPIGGDVMENYNLQINIPVKDNFNFFVFQDGGNVFLNTGNIRPFALYKSAGAGIMYLSPIGPVSFSYGYILTREPYWPAGGVNFTVGTSF
ncbi:MAG: outer membrane protein assembly factor BamA [bacterium]